MNDFEYARSNVQSMPKRMLPAAAELHSIYHAIHALDDLYYSIYRKFHGHYNYTAITW